MKQAIEDYTVRGVRTTLPFGHFVVTHPAFKRSDFTTNFVGEYFSGTLPPRLDHAALAQLAREVYEAAAQRLKPQALRR